MRPAGIGTWSNSGASTVNITGTLLAGSGGNTLTLSNATGSWTLSGGTISGGAMAFADGKSLFIAGEHREPAERGDGRTGT